MVIPLAQLRERVSKILAIEYFRGGGWDRSAGEDVQAFDGGVDDDVVQLTLGREHVGQPRLGGDFEDLVLGRLAEVGV